MTIDRRSMMVAVAGVLAAAWTGSALADETRPFSQDAFEAARKQGKSILVKVTAPWCPTCKAQKPILSRLTADPRFAKLVVFDVDFDSRKDVLKELGVQMQSTLIVYKGATETGRSAGDTDPAAIEALLSKAV